MTLDAIIAQHGEPEKWQKVRVSERVRVSGSPKGPPGWQKRAWVVAALGGLRKEGEPSQQHTAWVAS